MFLFVYPTGNAPGFVVHNDDDSRVDDLSDNENDSDPWACDPDVSEEEDGSESPDLGEGVDVTTESETEAEDRGNYRNRIWER